MAPIPTSVVFLATFLVLVGIQRASAACNALPVATGADEQSSLTVTPLIDVFLNILMPGKVCPGIIYNVQVKFKTPRSYTLLVVTSANTVATISGSSKTCPSQTGLLTGLPKTKAAHSLQLPCNATGTVKLLLASKTLGSTAVQLKTLSLPVTPVLACPTVVPGESACIISALTHVGNTMMSSKALPVKVRASQPNMTTSMESDVLMAGQTTAQASDPTLDISAALDVTDMPEPVKELAAAIQKFLDNFPQAKNGRQLQAASAVGANPVMKVIEFVANKLITLLLPPGVREAYGAFTFVLAAMPFVVSLISGPVGAATAAATAAAAMAANTTLGG